MADRIWEALMEAGAAARDAASPICSSAIPTGSRTSRSGSTTCSGLLQGQSRPPGAGALVELAEARGVPAHRGRDVRGDPINVTGPRGAAPRCATALNRPVLVDGKDVMPEINAVLGRMSASRRTSATARSRPRTDGPSRTWSISASGGSDLGPVMAALALAPYHDGPARTMSRMSMARMSRHCWPISIRAHAGHRGPKTFTTIETMTTPAPAQLKASLGGRRTNISPPSRPRSTRPPPSGSVPRVSVSGTGSYGRYGLGCRRAAGDDRDRAEFHRLAGMRWTGISSRRRSAATCRSCSG